MAEGVTDHTQFCEVGWLSERFFFKQLSKVNNRGRIIELKLYRNDSYNNDCQKKNNSS